MEAGDGERSAVQELLDALAGDDVVHLQGVIAQGTRYAGELAQVRREALLLRPHGGEGQETHRCQ